VELKQWGKVKRTTRDGIVQVQFQDGTKDVNHPSYQVYSYAQLLKSFNEVVDNEDIILKPCVYLHNYQMDGVIDHESYIQYLNDAPVFLKDDREKLSNFLSENIIY
jgi:uncharacterized protein